MTYVTAALCTLVRLLRPCGGLHADPSGYLRTLAAEYRRRSRRVRRYTLPEYGKVPPSSTGTRASGPAPNQVGPFIPQPRRPVDSRTPVPGTNTPAPPHPTGHLSTPPALLPTFRVRPGHPSAVGADAVPVAVQTDLVRTYYREHEQRARAARSRAGQALGVSPFPAA
ncbi:hypothetical protein ACWFMI_03010 [Nocardiopsis terrae]